MLGTLSILGSQIKPKKKIRVEHLIFRLHRYTCAVFLCASVLVMSAMYIGTPIMCFHDRWGINHMDFMAAIQHFCWLSSTFSLHHNSSRVIGMEAAYHGLGNAVDDQEIRYQAYYMWVPFVLFIQGLFFYIPHWLWKMWEGNRVSSIVSTMDQPLQKSDARSKKLVSIVNYFNDTLYSHNGYFLSFFFCEVFTMINCVAHIFFIDRFLGHEFTTYGWKVLEFSAMDAETRVDPMIAIFPRVTKCDFHIYGPSGMIEKYDAFCVIAQNNLNEKIYILLWFWLLVLAAVTALGLVYRLLTILSDSVRMIEFRVMKPKGYKPYDSLAYTCQIGDWFILTLIGKNMEGNAYGDMMGNLAQTVGISKIDQIEVMKVHAQ